MKDMKIGNTKIVFDTSYVDSLTEEEIKINRINFSESVWALMDDEMEEAV
ncbi:hypothetical protein [Paenibacillus sp. H1-7]|nr:hypothetical protein [Paenibacillus sp. H1-7]